jgi:hypothetical protein
MPDSLDRLVQDFRVTLAVLVVSVIVTTLLSLHYERQKNALRIELMAWHDLSVESSQKLNRCVVELHGAVQTNKLARRMFFD